MAALGYQAVELLVWVGACPATPGSADRPFASESPQTPTNSLGSASGSWRLFLVLDSNRIEPRRHEDTKILSIIPFLLFVSSWLINSYVYSL